MSKQSENNAGLTIMVQGTASDVGKSLVTAALCRIFRQDGYTVAPFKSQNMSLNSYVTWDGKEIGRAQGMQADACGVLATTDMNPILLKPTKEMSSQVVVHGKPLRDFSAREYRESYLPQAGVIVREALARLRSSHDIVVLEGAGSPAEINLKDRDIVNMRMAAWADAPVILVADIDRGGVFASIVGTLELLEPHERERVCGFVINKFRGDVGLLQPGVDWLEERTGKPVLGVLPFLPGLALEDEDSLSLDRKLEEQVKQRPDTLDIIVLRLPRISNFTDADPLYFEADVMLRFVDRPEQWGTPDAVILPGSKNTVEDLLWLREMGLAQQITAFAEKGGYLVGICGGYEMLGAMLLDPAGVESEHKETPGFGFFPFDVKFAGEKKTVRVEGHARAAAAWLTEQLPVEGYEIHMGEIFQHGVLRQPFAIRSQLAGVEPLQDGGLDYAGEGACSVDGRLWGTFIHGILHNDDLRRAWLNDIRIARGWEPLAAALRFRENREEAFDRLAEHTRQHLNMPLVYKVLAAGGKLGS
ncbi:cobyric acid synthase CobQ [Paenibacillus sp. BIHB 4019]|uniref:Cobyric acid synthase n=1 Tax=Paenibacillus sp. BIHB 4019 TaxID=1870819 RepID=A0A1B2DPE3_9BACL|nr:cobyric acid synthase [Paenibacillus sp. BIHB 4019]ANY69580.1 cobyric acid synthase CobQ [Paenibacillus sp. BIHB 4019]